MFYKLDRPHLLGCALPFVEEVGETVADGAVSVWLGVGLVYVGVAGDAGLGIEALESGLALLGLQHREQAAGTQT